MNLAPLLTPISDAAPCGVDLSFSPEFDAIAEDRRADDPSLDQGEWKTQLKIADWGRVEANCASLLVSRTKDLRLLGWLTEAMTHRHGFAGLADGLNLCAQSCEAFWPHLHPLPEDGDQEQRIGNLTWLLAHVVSLSLARPLVDAGAGRRYSLREVEAARTRAADMSAAEREASPLPPSGLDNLNAEALARAEQETSPTFFRDNLEQARRALSALLRLQSVVDARLGADGPGFVSAKAALEDVIHAAERLARDNGALVAAHQTAASTTSTTSTTSEGDPARAALQVAALAPAGPAGPAGLGEHGANAPGLPAHHIHSRLQALQQLRLAADFFRRTEPHSPVAYLAEKAVRWANMPLHEWLRVVLKDGSSLAHVEELLGINASSPDDAPG